MVDTKKAERNLTTVDHVIHGILEKKGRNVVKMNLKEIPNSVARYFVICDGTSTTHVKAIADSVIDYVKENEGDSPWQKEGYENSEWILIDYADTVVHVFQEKTRQFYKLEDLWADAEIQKIESDD